MKRRLGKSDVEITPIGLGVWQFSEAKGFHKFFWNKIEPDTRKEIVAETIKGGVNWFDTAEIYGNGRSERGLRDSLLDVGAKYPDILVATKWNPVMRTAKSIGKTIGKRIENLSPYPITLHQVHNPLSFSRPEREMEEMAKLLDAGKVQNVGVSNFNTKSLVNAYNRLEELGYPLVSNQVKYSILDRRVETNLIPKAKELGVTIIAYSPIEQGLATGRFHDNPGSLNSLPGLRKRALKRKFEKSRKVIEAMKSIAEEKETTVSQVALSWLINFSEETVVAIPGASKPHHAKINAGAMQVNLSREQMNTLDEFSQVFL